MKPALSLDSVSYSFKRFILVAVCLLFVMPYSLCSCSPVFELGRVLGSWSVRSICVLPPWVCRVLFLTDGLFLDCVGPSCMPTIVG